MDRAATRSFPRRPVQWNRPMTRRKPEISRIDLHTKYQRRFEDEGTNPSLLSTFLSIPEFSPRLDYELPVFKNILDETILKRICEGNFETPSNLAAWLHDRDLSNRPRGYNGSLSLLDFDLHLSLKRLGEKGLPDADTRKICINNPCQWTLGVLAVRAPEHQAPVIRDFIFKHLTARTSVSLDTVVDGGFTLEFHLAYPVWTRDPSPRRDQRVTGDGLPLRKSTDLSFLPGAQRSDQITHGFDYLHEAQTSICVTGRDTSQWTAIRLTDSYFEDDSDPNKEYLLPFYVADPYPDQDMTSCELDAISIANLTADNVSVTDPREYFLLVVKFHVARITEHWTNVLFKLKDMIEEYSTYTFGSERVLTWHHAR
ncbi:hypothetical protein BDP81DRAFT_72619 [Colletotrichum phormii]|uniref:Uncharacterized protein n=1 Tax=Colletotrichum phormii TaxID=359342 RepID=A0AAI9ZME7_9PEZI|nr:uncharacterized protein BDP81DRAFT_72619 [Colletotrichum phormii]KAK1633347.1 hypothetical protein BDP81DRAFT_72619 [Colletotrichum phormii]